MKIFLNPGHAPNGNPDPGAVHPRRLTRECDVALDVAKYCAKFLRNVGLEVQLVQEDSLAAISRIANLWNADIFISIHCNASASHAASGVESWHFYGSNKGRILSTTILEEIADEFPNLPWRGVKEGNFYVLRNTDMPATLVELGFIDNDADEAILTAYPERFGAAIARGVTDYLQA